MKQIFEYESKKQFLVDRPRMKRRRERDKKGGYKRSVVVVVYKVAKNTPHTIYVRF